MEEENPTQPWDQQPGEPDKMYNYFNVHKMEGVARNISKTAAKLDKSIEYLYQLSSEYNWRQRVQAWDNHQDQQWALEVKAGRRQMAKEHAAIADALMEKVYEKLANLNLDEMKPNDINKWTEVAIKAKRLAYGEPENITITGPNGGPIQHDITTLTVEQRRQRLQDLITEGINRTTGDQQ